MSWFYRYNGLTEPQPDEATIFSAEVRTILLAFKYTIRSMRNTFLFAPIHFPASNKLKIHNWTMLLFWKSLTNTETLLMEKKPLYFVGCQVT